MGSAYAATAIFIAILFYAAWKNDWSWYVIFGLLISFGTAITAETKRVIYRDEKGKITKMEEKEE